LRETPKRADLAIIPLFLSLSLWSLGIAEEKKKKKKRISDRRIAEYKVPASGSRSSFLHCLLGEVWSAESGLVTPSR